MSQFDHVKKEFLVLKREHEELLAYRDLWMSAWWRTVIFLLVLVWSWRRRYQAWVVRFEFLFYGEFESMMEDTLIFCEKKSRQGSLPYVPLLAQLDQLKAERIRLK